MLIAMHSTVSPTTVTSRSAAALAAGAPTFASLKQPGAAARLLTRSAAQREQRTCEFGKLVRARCTELGLTIRALHVQAGVSRSALFAALSGDSVPAPATLAALSEVLDVPVDDLARAAGALVTCDADVARLRRGLSRKQFASQLKMGRQSLFGNRSPQAAPTAYKAALAAGSTHDEAAQAAAAVRRTSPSTPLGQLIIDAMNERGLSYSQVAARLGVSRQAVTGWVVGTAKPAASRFILIAEALGVPVADLAEAAAASSYRWAHQGAELRKLRVAAGLRQVDVAEALGSTDPASDPIVARLEAGSARLTAAMVSCLNEKFGWALTATDDDLAPTPTPTSPASEDRAA